MTKEIIQEYERMKRERNDLYIRTLNTKAGSGLRMLRDDLYIKEAGGISRTSPKKIVIPEDLKKAVILWYNSGKSRKMGVVALDVKEHIFRRIVAESKEALA